MLTETDIDRQNLGIHVGRRIFSKESNETMKTPNFFEIRGKKVLVDANEVLSNGSIIRLTPKEKKVLQVLYENRGRTVSRAQILELVWGDSHGNDSGLSQAISKLRRVFQDDVKQPRLIKTVPKTGYKLMISSEEIKYASQKKPGILEFYLERSSLDRFSIRMLLLFIAMMLFFLIFDVNIRVEELAIPL